MSILEVGRPYSIGRRRWPSAVNYVYRNDGHHLDLFVSGITRPQESDVCRGAVELAMVVDESQIILCSRFGETIPWTRAAPFRWHEVPQRNRGIPADPRLTPKFHAQIRVALVETDGGLVRALRSVFLTSAFTSALHAAIREQADHPVHSLSPVWSVAKLYRLYQEPDAAGLLSREWPRLGSTWEA